MGVYIKNVTAKEINELFDEHAIWWIEPDDIIDVEIADRKTESNSEKPNNCEEPQTDCAWGKHE